MSSANGSLSNRQSSATTVSANAVLATAVSQRSLSTNSLGNGSLSNGSPQQRQSQQQQSQSNNSLPAQQSSATTVPATNRSSATTVSATPCLSNNGFGNNCFQQQTGSAATVSSSNRLSSMGSRNSKTGSVANRRTHRMTDSAAPSSSIFPPGGRRANDFDFGFGNDVARTLQTEVFGVTTREQIVGRGRWDNICGLRRNTTGPV